MEYIVIVAVGSTNHGGSCGIDQRKEVIRWEIGVNIIHYSSRLIILGNTISLVALR